MERLVVIISKFHTKILITHLNEMSTFAVDDDDRQHHSVEVLGHTFELTTAEDDFNPEKKTLFATHVWEGSKVNKHNEC